MNIQGKVTSVYDNRLNKDGTPNKYPNYRFKINDSEITLWSAIKPAVLEKDRLLSVTVQASKKNGSLFVQTNQDKKPMIQELPSPNTDFDPVKLEAELQAENKFDKEECIFVQAIAKSVIESGKINVTKVDIDLLLKDLKYLFKVNFRNS